MADLQTQRRLELSLAALVREAHSEGLDVAGWLAHGLASVALSLPGGVDELLAKRPGSWEADLVRRLVVGTVG